MKKFLYAARTALEVLISENLSNLARLYREISWRLKKIIIWQGFFFFFSVEVPSSNNYFVLFLIVTYEDMTIEF